MPPAKPHKPRKERVDELLESLRTRSTVDEESLISVLKDHRHLRKRFPDAQHFLSQVWQCAVFQRVVFVSIFVVVVVVILLFLFYILGVEFFFFFCPDT